MQWVGVKRVFLCVCMVVGLTARVGFCPSMDALVGGRGVGQGPGHAAIARTHAGRKPTR